MNEKIIHFAERDFSQITGESVRNHISTMWQKLPKDTIKFPAIRVAQLVANTPDVRGNKISLMDAVQIEERARHAKILKYSVSHGPSGNRIVYEQDEALLLTTLVWDQRTPLHNSRSIEWQRVVATIKRDLGNDPLKQKLLFPDASRKFII